MSCDACGGWLYTRSDPCLEPGGLLRKLMNVFMTVTVVNGQPQSMTTPVPEELQFESLDIRARAFTLES